VRRSIVRLSACVALILSGAAVCLALGLLSAPGRANDAKPAEPPKCTCPNAAPDPSKSPPITAKPKFAESNAHLDVNDEIAALEAIRVALTEVGDGGTYVWHRQHGRLSGIVQPTASFKDTAGRVCRHILLIMTVGSAKGRAEGIACRLADGRWQLDG
jgi:hypothetical protein